MVISGTVYSPLGRPLGHATRWLWVQGQDVHMITVKGKALQNLIYSLWDIRYIINGQFFQ